MGILKKAENYKAADIKVLMLGASRVGKTSILASMTDEIFRNKALYKSDLKLEVKGGPEYNIIRTADDVMRSYFDPAKPANANLEEGAKRTFLSNLVLNDVPGDRELDFSLMLSTKDKKGTYTIGFTDIPGEWVDKCDRLDDGTRRQLQDLVSSADVILVTVDSVLMMEENGINAAAGNKILNVTTLIKDLCSGSEDNPYKMVLFVPVKCEKYYHQHIEFVNGSKAYDEDPMEVLIGRIKKDYEKLFDYLGSAAQRSYFNVAILPVLTLGNIEFKTFNNALGTVGGQRTAKDMFFRYYRAKQYTPEGNLIPNTDISIPEFAPQFCEQPLVYILLFELAKIKKISEKKNMWSKLGNIIRLFKGLASDKDILAELPKVQQNIALNDYVSEIVQESIKMTKSH